MILANHKTKIVATIGPASNSPEMLESLIRAGMNIARLNFSHGNFEQHGDVIARIRTASKATGRRVAIMGDLPGPKMRLGTIGPGPIQLVSGDSFSLTSEKITGNFFWPEAASGWQKKGQCCEFGGIGLAIGQSASRGNECAARH